MEIQIIFFALKNEANFWKKSLLFINQSQGHRTDLLAKAVVALSGLKDAKKLFSINNLKTVNSIQKRV